MERIQEKKTRNYQNGKIYCIRNTQNDEVYVGSTCQSLSQRMTQHRADYKTIKGQRMKIYKHMFEYGIENYYIELLEEYPCENIEQLRKREGQFIRELDASLNTLVAGRNQKEYYKDNKEMRAQRDKEYYDKNTDKIKEKKKIYNQENREKINQNKKIYYTNNSDEIKAKAKQYRIDNKELMAKRDKEKYDRHREKILENKRQYYQRKKAEKQSLIEDLD